MILQIVLQKWNNCHVEKVLFIKGQTGLHAQAVPMQLFSHNLVLKRTKYLSFSALLNENSV